MKKLTILLVLILLMLGENVSQVQADAPPWADHTVTVSSDILTALDGLTYNGNIAYLAVVDVYHVASVYVISLVGLGSSANPSNWSITEAAWIGTAAVSGDYTQAALEGTPLYETLTAPVFDDWGGGASEPIFPWENGKRAYYGTRGVHDAGYGLSGWVAIDWVSGPSYGGGFYTNGVVASEDAQITYVCRDNTSVAVRAGNFLYAHLKDNATLEVGQNLYKGVKFAELVPGSFNNSCGWASQQPGNYHVHWGFLPSGGTKEIEDWLLTTSDQAWTKGSNKVRPGDVMVSAGANYSDGNEGGDYSAQLDGTHIWDSPIAGFLNTVVKTIIPRFPEGKSRDIGVTYLNAGAVAIRVFFILLKSNFNLTIFIGVVFLISILEPARVIYALYKLIKSAIPLA